MQMRTFLLGLNVNVTHQTILNFLNLKLITLQSFKIVPEARNSETEMEKRYNYTKKMVNEGISFKKYIYIDEAGFNLWLQRSYGISHNGERADRLMDNEVKTSHFSFSGYPFRWNFALQTRCWVFLWATFRRLSN